MSNDNRLLSSRLALAMVLAAVAAVPMAHAAQTGFSGHNAKDPIQFSADRLEVEKQSNVAVFLGKVEAVQGDMTLLGDEVRVYYQNDQKKQEGQASSSLTGSVSRIDSRGNVHITSRGDTAEGDWAVYDVSRQLVTMGGRVVMHQGDSVVRGSRIELHMDTGVAHVTGVPDLQGAQRVRGEFTPATNNKSTTDKKPSATDTKSDATPKKDK